MVIDFFEVVLEDTLTKARYLFNCNRWLAEDKEDGKIELELNLSTEQKNAHKSHVESSSSWNSSEDEDSISFGGRNKVVKTQAAKNLNKISEDLNETSFKKEVKKFESTGAFGPPQISDFEDSDQEDDLNNNNLNQFKSQASPAKASEEIFDFLSSSDNKSKDNIKKESKTNTTVAKKPSLGDLFLKKDKQQQQGNSPRSDVDDIKSQSITSFLNTAENLVDKSKKNSSKQKEKEKSVSSQR